MVQITKFSVKAATSRIRCGHNMLVYFAKSYRPHIPQYARAWYSEIVMVFGKRQKNILMVVCIIGILLVAGTTYVWLFLGHSDVSPIPQRIISRVSFPVYYPTTLPTNYTLKTDSAVGTNTTVYYTLADDAGKNAITVTLQATPATFDASKIIGSNPISTSITSTGTLYNLSAGSSSKYMLNTGKTLIFITSPTTIDGTVMNTITNNLAQVKTK